MNYMKLEGKGSILTIRKIKNSVGRHPMGRLQFQPDYNWIQSNKLQNKKQKIKNGYGRKALNLVHWNMGARKWVNKIHEISQVIVDFHPDILTISEANIFNENEEYECVIPGYTRYQPNTLNSMGYCRIAVLAKNELQVETIDTLMRDDTATVWLKMRRRGQRNLIIGSIYREQTLLKQQDPNLTDDDRLQKQRWSVILQQWLAASRMGDVVILADTNLDYIRWDNPAQRNRHMVNETKNVVVGVGFYQLIHNVTRTWKDQQDSIIDQIWTNAPNLIIGTRNVVRGASDHNVITATVRLKGGEGSVHELIRRDRRNFSQEKYKKKLSEIKWEELYSIENLDRANLWFERKLTRILEWE